MAKGVPNCSWKALQYHSPTSLENPYAENGGGSRSIASSGVGHSPARSNTMDDETYTTFAPTSVAVRKTRENIRLFSSRMSAGYRWKYPIPPIFAARWKQIAASRN